jgi:peptidoglycan hydrolase-like protein with peptidoglycan-binding domain
VRLLQEYLNIIAETYPEIPTVEETGIFGAMTEEAVTAFQRQFDIPPTGRVAATTWNAVTSVYEDIVRGNQLREGQFPGFTVQ